MLKQEQIQECQSKFNLSYHVNFAHICQQLVGFENKDVLEVGGSLPPDFVFDYLGVKSWTGIETPDYEKSLEETGGITHTGTIIKDIKNISNCKFNNQPEGKYNFYLENIEDLPEEYYNQYDLIFSIATFEHIHKLPLALDKMFLALKPGGKLFSMFAPIWSAYDGHHLPNLVDKQGKKFHFGDSPIPPWGHLLMSPPEMYSYLCQFTDKETANLMVYYIYHSPHINRLFTEDYLAYINQSSFITDKIDLIFTHPIDLEIKSKLEHFYPGRKYFQNNGILLICGKQEEKNLLQSDQQQPDNIKKEIDIMDNSNLSASSKLICIDLGCGTHKAEGFIGVDVVAADGVDVIANLNGYFPFPDNSVDFLKAHDIIEHLPDRIHTMNEIWRILKPDGIVDISVPSTDGRGAFQDPTHVSFWNINSFMYYCQEFPPYLAGCQSHYGFKGQFSIVSIDQKNSGNQVIHVHAVLKAIKSEENNYPLNLRNINLIIFPDWSQSMEVIFEQLVNLCQAIIDHPNNSDIALLIDIQNTNLEDANFLLADVLLNLCYQGNMETDDDKLPQFNLFKTNSPQEYKGLLPILHSRIILESENKKFINQIGLEQIPAYTLDELNTKCIHISKDQSLISQQVENVNNIPFHNVIVRPNPGDDNPLWQYFCNNQKRLIYKWHHYFDIYHNHFSRFRGLPIKVLEIGVAHGGSLQMWKSYFGEQAYIYGIDIDPRCKQLEEERVEIFSGSQTDRDFLQYVRNTIGTVDIIIDDGGHTMEQQICSFEELYPAVQERGIYLVEDLHTSYWSGYGGGYKKEGTFIEYAKNFIDQLNAWHSQDHGLTPSYLTKTCTGLHFYDSVLVIEKYPNHYKPKTSMTGKFSF